MPPADAYSESATRLLYEVFQCNPRVRDWATVLKAIDGYARAHAGKKQQCQSKWGSLHPAAVAAPAPPPAPAVTVQQPVIYIVNGGGNSGELGGTTTQVITAAPGQKAPTTSMQALQALVDGGDPAPLESIVSMGGRDDHGHHHHDDHHPIYHPTHYTHYAEDVDEYSGGGGQSLCSDQAPAGPVITHQAPAIYIVNGGCDGTVAVPDAVPDAAPALPAPAFEALDAPAPPPAADTEPESLAFLLFAADFMLTQLADPLPQAIAAYEENTEPYLQRLQQNPDDRAAAKEWFRVLQTMASYHPSPVPTNPDGWAGFQAFVRFMTAGRFPFFTD
jgi:hypothetical protein